MKATFHPIFILDPSTTVKIKVNHHCNTTIKYICINQSLKLNHQSLNHPQLNHWRPIITEANHNQPIWTFRILSSKHSHQNTKQNLEFCNNNQIQLQLQISYLIMYTLLWRIKPAYIRAFTKANLRTNLQILTHNFVAIPDISHTQIITFICVNNSDIVYP